MNEIKFKIRNREWKKDPWSKWNLISFHFPVCFFACLLACQYESFTFYISALQKRISIIPPSLQTIYSFFLHISLSVAVLTIFELQNRYHSLQLTNRTYIYKNTSMFCTNCWNHYQNDYTTNSREYIFIKMRKLWSFFWFLLYCGKVIRSFLYSCYWYLNDNG